MVENESDPVNEFFDGTWDADASDLARFQSTCVSLRRNHVLAFFLGLVTFGVIYGMAGIGGSVPSEAFAPLPSLWSNRTARWIAILALLVELVTIPAVVVQAFQFSAWTVFAFPFLFILALGICEILFAFLFHSDGFGLVHIHVFRCDPMFIQLRGPSRMLNSLITSLPRSVRPLCALFWAWTLGAVLVGTFITGVAIAIGLCGCVVISTIITLVWGTLGDGGGGGGGEPPPPDPIMVFPPIPFNGCVALNELGQIEAYRVGDIYYANHIAVGEVDHKGIVYFYTRVNRRRIATYRFEGTVIHDLIDRRIYGSFDNSAILDRNGRVLYGLQEVEP